MNNEYYEFKNEKNAIYWLTNNYYEFISDIRSNISIDGTLGDALFSYTGNMSKDYNAILKSNNGDIVNIDNIIDVYYDDKNADYIKKSCDSFFAKEAKNDIKLIYKSFELNRINDNVILFHYFNSNFFFVDLLKEHEFHINHFISATMVENSLGIRKLIYEHSYDLLLKIKVKKGTPCIPILWRKDQSNLNEYEIILKPQSKFIINKIRKKYFSKIKYIIDCEII